MNLDGSVARGRNYAACGVVFWDCQGVWLGGLGLKVVNEGVLRTELWGVFAGLKEA